MLARGIYQVFWLQLATFDVGICRFARVTLVSNRLEVRILRLRVQQELALAVRGEG